MAKSKEELENEILELRANILHKVLEDKTNAKPAKIKEWTPIILTIVSIIAGLFGILLPAITYINQQKDEYKFKIEQDMVKYVNDLSSSDGQDQEMAILMLSYYEKDAVPILLHKLERIDYKYKHRINTALQNIKSLSKKDNLFIEDMLLRKAIEFHTKGYIEPVEEVYNKIDGLLNYIFMLGEFGDFKRNEIESFLADVTTALPENSIHEETKNDIIKEIELCKKKLQQRNA